MTDINDVIKTIDELIDGGVLTQYAIAREAGISDGTLSAFRKGKYKGDNAAVAASLRSWYENWNKQSALPEPYLLRMASLTNDPGITGMNPVAALSADDLYVVSPSQEQSPMNEQLRQLLTALGLTVADGDEFTPELGTAALSALTRCNSSDCTYHRACTGDPVPCHREQYRLATFCAP